MPQLSKRIEDCTEVITNSIVPVEQNGKKIIFHNTTKKQIKKIRVDGCVLAEGKACDYLVKTKVITNIS